MFGEFLGSGTNITKGLWHLNGNITDSSGNGQTGTATNVTWVNGLFGQCASFNGSTSQIYGNSSASLSVASTTMSIWIKTNFQQTTYCYIMNNYKSGNLGNLGLALHPTHIRCALYNQGPPLQYYDLDTTINYYDNKWHNYVTTYSGGLLKFYSDGQLLNSVSTYNYIIGNFWTIGTNAQNSLLTYNGLIDEVIIENYAWTAEQIKKYYTYCKGRFGI